MIKKIFCIKLLVVFSFNIFFVPYIHCGKKTFKGKFGKKSKHNLKWQKYAKKMNQQRKKPKPPQHAQKKFNKYEKRALCISEADCKSRLKRRKQKKFPIYTLPKQLLKSLLLASVFQTTSCEEFDDIEELGDWVFEDIKHNEELQKNILKYGESIEDLFANAIIEVPEDSPLNDFGQNITFKYNVKKKDYSTLVGTACVCVFLGVILPILCIFNYYHHKKAGKNSVFNPPQSSTPNYDYKDETESDTESSAISTVASSTDSENTESSDTGIEEEQEITTDSETSETTDKI